jgi:hypothetical protein
MHHRALSALNLTRRFRLLCYAGALISVGTLAGCGRDEIIAPDGSASVGQQFTVDAATSWVYVDLATGATVALTDPSSSTTWDIAFNATSVQLNGGTAGPAGVTGFCLCTNADASNDEILQMTPDNQKSVFTDALNSAIPADGADWSSDVFEASPWYRYDLAGDHHISPTFDVYFIKRDATIYKIQIINYYGPAGETRQITTRYSKVRG